MAEYIPDIKELTRVLQYNPEKSKAYCKYCYGTHKHWVFDGEIVGNMIDDVWLCRKCDHRTHDRNMQIDSEALCGAQELIYKDYTRAFGIKNDSDEIKEYRAWQ